MASNSPSGTTDRRLASLLTLFANNATIAMSGPDSLWVKACALGRFYCSGNLWSRIGGKPEKLVISRQTSPEPRS